MTPYILGVLGLWLVAMVLPTPLRYLQSSMSTDQMLRSSLGSRDDAPDPSPMASRADRARWNLLESLPFFLTFAFMEFEQPDSLAVTGALVFIGARLVYMPLYIFGVFGLRSAAWTVGMLGIAMMAYAALN